MPIKIVRKSREKDSPSPGKYATSSFSESKPWASTSVSASKPKTRRAKPAPVVVNPIFEECAKLATDPTWKIIFEEASFGKLPRGFTYKDGFITHKIRNKTSRVEISTDPHLALVECIDFFKTKAGIMSENDQRKAREEFEEYLIQSGSLVPQKWSEIRRKKVKDVLISTFISKLGHEISLKKKKKKDLHNKIYLGFILGCFGNDQVNLVDGYISSIGGLNFDEINRRFYIDYLQAPKQLKKSRHNDKSETKAKNSFYLLWVKFLESLEKKASRANNTTPSVVSTPRYEESNEEINKEPVIVTNDSEIENDEGDDYSDSI